MQAIYRKQRLIIEAEKESIMKRFKARQTYHLFISNPGSWLFFSLQDAEEEEKTVIGYQVATPSRPP